MKTIVEKLNNLEYLTDRQYNWLMANDVNFVQSNFTYVGYPQYGDYLNLQVYSEHGHDKRQYEMEIG